MTPKHHPNDQRIATVTRLVGDFEPPRFCVRGRHGTYEVAIKNPDDDVDSLNQLRSSVKRNVLYDARRRPCSIQGKTGVFVDVEVVKD